MNIGIETTSTNYTAIWKRTTPYFNSIPFYSIKNIDMNVDLGKARKIVI